MRETVRTTRDDSVRHILSLSPNEDDHAQITRLLAEPPWTLHKADCLSAALAAIRRHPVSVVVCERDLPPGTWVDALDDIRLLEHAPPLVVTSRLADERLWAEALNLGAYDVLAKPFYPQELRRTVELAFLHWRHSHDETSAVTKVMTARWGGGRR